MNGNQQYTTLNFDATNVNPELSGGSFFPVSGPNGWLCRVTADNGMKAIKDNKGHYLELEVTGMEGEVDGKTAVLRFNIQHEDPKIIPMAYAELSALGHCVGVIRIATTADIMNKPFRLVSENQTQTEADKQANKTPYTQLARNGYRDVNGNKPKLGQVGPQGGNGGNTGGGNAGGPPANPNQNNQNWQGGGNGGNNAGNNGNNAGGNNGGNGNAGGGGDWNNQNNGGNQNNQNAQNNQQQQNWQGGNGNQNGGGNNGGNGGGDWQGGGNGGAPDWANGGQQ